MPPKRILTRVTANNLPEVNQGVITRNRQRLLDQASTISSSQTTNNSNTNPPNVPIQLETNTSQDTIRKLLEDGTKIIFRKKSIKIGNETRYYSAILNFFECPIEFNSKPLENIQFKCLTCRNNYSAKLGESSNLKKHLYNSHENLRNWLDAYVTQSHRNIDKFTLCDKTVLLTKYFLSSSSAMVELENPYLRKLLTFKLPSPFTFKRKIIRKINKNLNKSLEEKLIEANFVCLIIDLWSNLSNEQFLAVGASMIFKNFKKETRVIGMVKTNGSSNAESIKELVEIVVNKFDFDKKKKLGVVCDQGSSLLRLFKQNENFLFDEYIENNNQTSNETSNIENLSQEQTVSDANSSILYNDFRTLLNSVDNEIEEILDDDEEFIVEPDFESEDEDDSGVFVRNEESEEYESEEINILNIELGTNMIPRYSCAAHKINLAVRAAIKSCPVFSNTLTKLSKFASSIRRFNVLSVNFIEKKAKLRCENGTRAYEKDAFSPENPCLVDKNTITSYLKILHPLYTLSLMSQNKNFVEEGLRGEKKKLVKALKKSLKERFQFELESKIYLLKALLNTSKLYLRDENFSNSPEQTASIPTTSYSNNENRIFRSLLRAKAYETPQDVVRSTRKDQIKKEIDLFLQLLNDRTTFAKST
ncbi:zinc finger BED domain-containing 1-like [Brachionus plicatilis]|uniref:Zinc finger BED domain-containing 1-like n=1 Tax=Brachionus plicatilis TaxID=10195 RepID=A0A3M7QDB4_BRAPC|nr:zinc finger BED domain-containing 1-like [Brachionus plicatilis]